MRTLSCNMRSMATRTNWTRYGFNPVLGVECYRGSDGRWYARNMTNKTTRGPYTTRRAARLAAYEICGR